MRRYLWVLMALLLSVSCSVSRKSKQYAVIPFPQKVEMTKRYFTFSERVTFRDRNHLFGKEISDFNSFLNSQYGFSLKEDSLYPAIVMIGGTPINLILKPNANPDDESYSMDIEEDWGADEINITGTQAGIFYGLQTLKQILQSENGFKIRCGVFEDSPRYSWRGMHLDVCRHFFGVDDVKKYIDLLALCKMNTFHWHLTDDQGWRIEIKQYPLLAEKSAFRKETVIGKPSDTAKYDGKRYGGFYTQKNIKDIVAYATQKHITIVPEIEMPGHALAALAAYPQFSCRQQPLEVGTTWGVFEDVYCAGNDSTFQFLENVLSEVCELFPGKYIHIGGDECPKERWKTCVKCQARIKNEHLKDEHELQSYFIRRIEKFLNSKGKQIIGWDEMLEGGLAPNAAVMSWRGTAGGIEAAKQKHYVVMSPGSPCYFDHYQSKDKEHEPMAIGGYNPLDSVYAYEPTPKELADGDKHFILGAQGNVWTEYIPDFSHVEYMSVPRMFALSETLWTAKKNYKDFIYRLKRQSRLLDKMHVNYAKHFLN